MMPQPVDISQSTERPQPIDPSHSPIDSHVVSPSRITDGKRSKYIGRAWYVTHMRSSCYGDAELTFTQSGLSTPEGEGTTPHIPFAMFEISF